MKLSFGDNAKIHWRKGGKEGSHSVVRKLEGQMSGRVGGRRVGGRRRGVFGDAADDADAAGLIADFGENGKSCEKEFQNSLLRGMISGRVGRRRRGVFGGGAAGGLIADVGKTYTSSEKGVPELLFEGYDFRAGRA